MPLRRQAAELLPPRATIRPTLIVLALLVVYAAAAQTLDPAEAIEEVRQAFSNGDYAGTLSVVRKMRIQAQGSKEMPEALLLAARAALSSQPFRARFFVDLARRHPHTTDAILFEIAVVAADLSRRDRFLIEAQQEMKDVLRVPPAAVAAVRVDQVRLQAAELSLYELNDRATAAFLALQIDEPSKLGVTEWRAYQQLVKTLLWSRITPESLGLRDANISAIVADGDDVWIGTSNGGAARYSQSTGIATRFTPATSGWQLAETIRSIEVNGNWVWFGTFEGLSVYSKATSRIWRINIFGKPGLRAKGDPPPLSIVAIEALDDGGIAVGAIGAVGDSRGLWIADDPDGEWRHVKDGNLPGLLVKALKSHGSTLYIGTQDIGVVVLDLETGHARRAEALWAAGAVDVRALVVDDTGKVWVGTYGAGLFRWDPNTDRVARYSTSSGTLADDYVMAAAATAGSVVFGTFGAGAYQYSVADGKWTAIDLDSGLPHLDIMALEQSGSFTYFGTLGGGVAVLADSLEHAARAASL